MSFKDGMTPSSPLLNPLKLEISKEVFYFNDFSRICFERIIGQGKSVEGKWAENKMSWFKVNGQGSFLPTAG